MSTGRASTGIPAVDQFTDVFVFDELASVSFCQAFFHLTEEPFVVFHETFYRFLHHRLCNAALLSGKTSQFSVKLGRKIYFHRLKG
ncbi:MAG: hypothetical protein WAM65_10255 [Candidatus Korobacteraceae bacterium]